MSKDLSRFFRKLLLFPLAVILGVVLYESLELFVFPIDLFTFRAWEALCVRNLQDLLPGPFYPGLELRKQEEGDLGHGTPWATRREALWRIDPYGYRNDPPDLDDYPIVVTGDSFPIGCGNDQSEMLGRYLQKALGQRVYTLAPVREPRPMDLFLSEPRFRAHPPRVVVLVMVERNFKRFDPELRGTIPYPKDPFDRYWRWLGELMPPVTADRISKRMLWNYLFAKAGGRDLEGIARKTTDPSLMLFFQGDEAAKEPSPGTLARIDRTLLGMKAALQERGIRFLVVPVPDKESVYDRYLPGKVRPRFLERLEPHLRAEGIEAVDLLEPFRKAAGKKGALLYHRDDTHWNAQGTRMAAEELSRHLSHGPRIGNK